MRLLLVRHGETEWNADRRLQGQRDIPLSLIGEQQARALRPIIESHAPETVMTSPLLRALRTAETLGHGATSTDPRWMEADLGVWTGRTASDLLESGEPYAEWRAGRATPPGGESFEALTERVTAAAAELMTAGGVALVVTHGGPIRALVHHLIGLAPERIVPVDPGSLTIIDVDDQPRLRAYSVHAAAARLAPPD